MTDDINFFVNGYNHEINTSNAIVRKQKMEKIKNNRKSYIPLCFFIAGVVLRFILGSYLKTPTIYWDELKYYGLARSIFQGSGLLVRNTSTNFQKILYPLILSPFFSIEDPAVRVRMITLLNAILMNSCVFPLWIICSKMGMSRSRKIWLSALLIIWPDMLMTETFMSENLYWPLFFWYIVLHFYHSKNKPLLLGIPEGIFIYWGYLCKEVFLFVIPVTALCLIIEIKLCPRSKDEMRLEWLRLISTTAVFGMLLAIGKLTVFSGMGTGGYTPDIGAVFTGSSFVYLIYSALYLLAAMILSILILPIAIPILRFKQLKREHQQFFLYMMVFILFLIIVVAASIYINEDNGSMIPRIHLRYFAPAVFLLLPVLAVCPERPGNAKKDTELAVLLIFAIFVVALFRSANATDTDQMTLQWASGFNELFTGILPTDSYMFWILQVVEVSLTLGISIGLYMFLSQRGKDYVQLFFIMLLVPILSSNVIGHISIMEDYSDRTECWESVCSLNKSFSETEGNILYLTDNCDQNRHSKTWDCCFEPVRRMYYYVYSAINLVDEEFVSYDGIYKKPDFDPNAETGSFTFSGYVDKGFFSKTDHIEYVVVPNEANLMPVDDSCYELIPSMSDEYYTVYQNKNPQKLNLANFIILDDTD